MLARRILPLLLLSRTVAVAPISKPFLVASAAITPIEFEKEKNWQTLADSAAEAAAAGAALVLYPEGFLDGYVINTVNGEPNSTRHEELVRRLQNVSEPLDGPYIERARALAKKLGIYLLFGFLQRVDAAGHTLHNSVVLLRPSGEIALVYQKTHFAQGYAINPSCYKPGRAFPTTQTTLGHIGALICFDRHLPEVVRSLAVGGAQLVLNPSYGGYDGLQGMNTAMLRTRAYENGVYYIFTNPHQSLFINPRGDVELMGPAGAMTYHNVSLRPTASSCLGVEECWAPRRPNLYDTVTIGPDPSRVQHEYQC
jgi:predicted amidohydrolase